MNLNKEENLFFENMLKLFFEYGEIYLNQGQFEDNKELINKLLNEKIIFMNDGEIEKIDLEPETYNLFVNKYYRGQKEISFTNGKIFYFDSKFIKDISKERLNRKINKTGHDQIIYSFINYLKNKNSNQLYLSNFEIKTKYGITRPDLYVLEDEMNVEDLRPICYEIKYSHNDFMSDIKKPKKRASYLEISECLFYVCPVGVIKPNEVPEECGLIYMDENGGFEKIIEAKKHDQWKVNFNYSFLIRLIKSQNMIYQKIIINQEVEGDFNLIKSNIFDSLNLKNHVLLSKRQVDIVFKISKMKEVSLRGLGLFSEEYNIVLDLIGLDLLNFEKSSNNYINCYDKSLKFKPTERLLFLHDQESEIKNSYDLSVVDRHSRDKFVYGNVFVKGVLTFDNYSFNKTNNDSKINAIGYILLDHDHVKIEDINNEFFLKEKMKYCEKLAFITHNGKINKKEIPKDCSLFYDEKSYSRRDIPFNEVKRGKKKNIETLNDQIFWELLKQEYQESIISFILN